MNEFLNYSFLDNTVKDYLISIGIIVLIIVLKRLLSRYLASVIAKLITSKKQSFDKTKFHHLVLAPIEMFLIILAVVVAFHRLNYPTVLHFNIWKTSFADVLESISIIALILSFIWLCIRIMEYIAGILHEKAQLTDDRSDDQLIVFFRELLKVILGIIGLLLIIKYGFRQDLGALLTGLSIVGAALALAFRESLENLIASFIIFFDKPFTIGDYVKVQGVNGKIEKIGLRSTRIRTIDKTFVTVPNKQMVDSILDNQSLRTQRKAELNIQISQDAIADQLKEFIASCESILIKDNIEDACVYLSETGQGNNIVHVEYFTSIAQPVNEFQKLREAVNLELITAQRKLADEIADAIKSKAEKPA
jgi:MscS family membrane protein